jgi:hypothetical protein
MNKQVFTTVVKGTTYDLPKWTLTENGIELTNTNQRITFLRGTKDNDSPIVNGVLHEQLLAMMVEDLSYKQSLVPSPITEGILQCYKTALELFNKREKDRVEREVINTNNP